MTRHLLLPCQSPEHRIPASKAVNINSATATGRFDNWMIVISEALSYTTEARKEAFPTFGLMPSNPHCNAVIHGDAHDMAQALLALKTPRKSFLDAACAAGLTSSGTKDVSRDENSSSIKRKAAPRHEPESTIRPLHVERGPTKHSRELDEDLNGQQVQSLRRKKPGLPPGRPLPPPPALPKYIIHASRSGLA